MNIYSEDQQKLLDQSSSSSSSELEDFLPDEGSRHWPARKDRKLRLLCFRVIFFALILIVVGTNVAWYQLYLSKSIQPEKPYYGSTAQIMIPFDHDWRGLDAAEVDGHHYADDKWEDIFPVYGGSVALSRPFAQKYDLPLGASVNDDPSRMHYLMAGYHQLHCLKVVRETIYQLNGTSSNTEPVLWDHVLHCVEAVRQALFCFMDDTLVPLALEWPGIPNGQQHVCRNSNAIRKWAESNEHELPPNPHGPPAHNHSTKT